MNSNTAITREEIMLFLNRRNCNLPLYKGMKEKFNLKTDQSVFNILHSFFLGYSPNNHGRHPYLCEDDTKEFFRVIDEQSDSCNSIATCQAIGLAHTHTVCVPYYKAAPYNISHT